MAEVVKRPINLWTLDMIIEKCGYNREDAPLLMRVAFGMSSPRIRMLNIREDQTVYSVIRDCDFEDPLKAFKTRLVMLKSP